MVELRWQLASFVSWAEADFVDFGWWWRYTQRWRRRRVLTLALSIGELSGGVVFRSGPRRSGSGEIQRLQTWRGFAFRSGEGVGN